MSGSYRMALGVTPLFLRIALGVVFIYAGLQKFMARMDTDPATAAVLANMGVLTPGGSPDVTPGSPDKPLPNPPANSPTPAPSSGPSDAPKPDDSDAAPKDERNVMAFGEPRILRASFMQPDASAPGPATTSTRYTAADFPNPPRVKPIFHLAAGLYNYAHPVSTPENPNPMPLWPPALAKGQMPVVLAYAVAITELVGGVLIVLGLCTRLAAFGIAGVMLGALWLTQIGPAIQSGNTILGFLPAYDRWDGMAWQHPMHQFVLLMIALALVFCGPGYLAADHALFGRRGGTDDHDGE